MKYLSHYVEQKQTELFTRLGTFFAFSTKQFDEQKQDGIVYVSLGAGTITPKGSEKELMSCLETIHAEGIKADIAENGKEAIIQRELANHEAQITGNLDSTIDALDGYNIPLIDIKNGYSVFYKECVKNDWF